MPPTATTDRPFLITGCGRSGTAWAAAMMTALGRPCGHEAQFTVTARPEPGTLPASDSSWLAAPFVADLPARTSIVRMMRDPDAVVQSAVQRGFLRDVEEPFAAYALRHCPIIGGATDWLGRVIRWATFWDAPLITVPHRTIYLEAPHLAELRRLTRETITPSMVGDAMTLVGRPNANADEPSKVLHHRPTIADLYEHRDGHLLIDRAERYGYR